MYIEIETSDPSIILQQIENLMAAEGYLNLSISNEKRFYRAEITSDEDAAS
jgi:hypothetical protein